VKTARKATNKALYKLYEGSGGEPNLRALAGGSKYTGSYIHEPIKSVNPQKGQPSRGD
jgi:hypothetical protein